MAGDATAPASGGRMRWLEPVLVLVFLLTLAIAFYIKRETLLIGLDGAYMQDLARRQFAWGIPAITSSLDTLQGAGDVFFGVNFTLLPAYIAGSLFGPGETARIAIYWAVCLELSAGVFLLGRALGLGPSAALGAGLGLALIVLPLFESAALYPIMATVPHVATFIAVVAVMIWAFVNFGRRGGGRGGVLRDLGFLAVFAAGLAFLIFSAMIVFVLSGPIMLIAALSGTVAAQTRRERWLKIALLIGGVVVMASGPAYYLLGLLLNSAPIFFPIELQNDRATLLYSSVLFHWSLISAAGTILLVLAFIGAAWSIIRPADRTLKIFGITLLSYFAVRVMFFVVTTLIDFWRGPSPLYFEFFVLPLYAVFAAVAVTRLIALARHLTPRLRAMSVTPVHVRCGVWGLAAVAAIGMAAGSKTPTYGFPYPPTSTEMIAALPDNPGLAVGQPFRGRVATLTGRVIDGPVTWFDLHQLDDTFSRLDGNDYRMIGLTYFGVPSLFQYGSTTTPAFYAVATRLLAREGDAQLRSVLTLRRYNPKVLAMLGVSHVLTDAPLDGAEQVVARKVGDHQILAYRVPDANIAGYAPTRVVPGLDATAILRRMDTPAFDPRSELLATLPPELAGRAEGLVPVTASEIMLDGPAVTVRATSEGLSVLLLPLEFSRCLKVQSSGAAALFRGNLMLTAVVFERTLDARIALGHGPFTDPFCRLRDMQDLRELGVQDVPVTPGAGRG